MKDWINNYHVGQMKQLTDEFKQWLRHKNLQLLNKKFSYKISNEQIKLEANGRLDWYKRASGSIISFLLNLDILAIRKKNRG